MSYEKQNFRSGDVLSAEDLNEMDDQIAANEEAIADVEEAIENLSVYTFTDANSDGNIVITAGGDS